MITEVFYYSFMEIPSFRVLRIWWQQYVQPRDAVENEFLCWQHKKYFLDLMTPSFQKTQQLQFHMKH